jgi:hypothetical protein
MALNRNAQSQVQSQQPAFEDEDDMTTTTTVETPEVVEQATPTRAANVPAPAAKQALATPAPKVQAAFLDYQDRFSIDQVADASGAVPKLTADLGGIDFGDKKVCTEVRVQLLSYNTRTLVTSGIEGEAGKKLLRTSYDGVHLQGEGETQTVQEYLHYLKEVEGCEKATARGYIDLWVVVVEEDGKEVPEEDRQLFQVQLSPQSVKKFKAFQMSQGVKAAFTKGSVSETFRLKTERNEYNGYKYANFVFLP